jgi:hypothetical protein
VSLNALNPYSVTAEGWGDTTDSRMQRYDRVGPPADPRAATDAFDEKTSPFQRHVAMLRAQAAPRVDFERLYDRWAKHPRRFVRTTTEPGILDLFPAAPDRAALVDEMRGFEVQDVRGHRTVLFDRIMGSSALSAAQKERVLHVLADVRWSMKTRAMDDGYDDINWRHACGEVGQVLGLCEEAGVPQEDAEDAILASVFSDAAKFRGNFLVHNVDGAVAAAHVLARFFDVERSAAARARVVRVCQACVEHQVGPPRFMGGMVRMSLERKLLEEGVGEKELDELRPLLDDVQARIADPLNPDHVSFDADGAATTAFDASVRAGARRVDEKELLALVGIERWYVPHPATPWYVASSTVIDADSLVNYVTPDGVGKIVAICGPGTVFHDGTLFHSIFSCGASYVDAVSVMSDEAMAAVKDGVRRTRAAIEAMRTSIAAELEAGSLIFQSDGFLELAIDETADLDQVTGFEAEGAVYVDVPWRDDGTLPYWNAPLDYASPGPEFEFAKLLRRKAADLLRAADRGGR